MQAQQPNAADLQYGGINAAIRHELCNFTVMLWFFSSLNRWASSGGPQIDTLCMFQYGHDTYECATKSCQGSLPLARTDSIASAVR